MYLKKLKEVDCHAICSKLVETGGELWEKVIYFVNEEENCLDIKYKSRKGKGELGIEEKSDDYDIWVITNSAYKQQATCTLQRKWF